MIPPASLGSIPGPPSLTTSAISFQHGAAAPSHSHANLAKAFRVIVLTNSQTATITEGQSLNRPAANKAKGRIQRFVKLSVKAPLKPLVLMGLMSIVHFSVSWLL